MPVQGPSVYGHWHYGDWRDFIGSICSAQVLDGHSGHNIDIDWPMVHLEDRRGSTCGCITSNRLGLCAAGSDAFFVAKPRTRGALPAPFVPAPRRTSPGHVKGLARPPLGLFFFL